MERGNLFRRGSRKQQRIRGDSDAPKIKPVSIKANGEGGFGLGHTAVVDAAGGDEEFHARVVELEVVGLAEVDSELGSALAVAGVGVLVVAAGIVEEGEEADDLRVGAMVAAQFHAVAQDGEPMGRAVVGGFGKAELGDDELPERNFARAQRGKIVGRMGRYYHKKSPYYLASRVRLIKQPLPRL